MRWGARPAPAGPLLRRVVRRALAAAAATDGVFDPLLGRQLEEVGYDVTFDRIASPPPSDAPATPGGAWRRVEVDDAAGTITLPAGARLDLGGIAKGMAVDASITLLEGLGVESALVSAGGDIAVIAQPEGWPVEVQTHDGAAVVSLLCGAIATSTTRRRRWLQGGVERHHLLDPATRPSRPFGGALGHRHGHQLRGRRGGREGRAGARARPRQPVPGRARPHRPLGRGRPLDARWAPGRSRWRRAS